MCCVEENSWNSGLEGACLRIAGTDHSPIRVVAGPGTGKTFALMRRIARFLQSGVPSDRLLVCTFTRTAARDLRREIDRLGIIGASKVRAGTIHSFCYWLLSEADVLLQTDRTPRTLLSFEERFLLEDIVGDLFGGIRDKRIRLSAFNAAWARLQSDDPGWPNDEVDQLFHQELIGWLHFHNALLVGELVPEALRFLRDNPASPYRRMFDHVLVDEYQDLNRSEQVFLELLASSGSLFVVGDEDQSIYSFKFAHPEGIAEFGQTHPATYDEQLDECRRCPNRIVDMANALISNNQTRVTRFLNQFQGNPEGEVHVIQWDSLEEEAEGIARIINARLLAGDVELGQVLVLAPRRQFGYAVRDALNDLGVPAHSFFHEEALEGDPCAADRYNAQKALTLLTLIVSPLDIVALRCWCGFGSPTLNRRAWQQLRSYCYENGEVPIEVLAELESGHIQIPYTRPLLEPFRELRERAHRLSGISGEKLVDELFPENEDWAISMRAISATIGSDDFTPAELYEALKGGITQPELPTDVDYIRVMSLHKSKGLTADMVVVVGCIEGLIPTVTGDTQSQRTSSLEEQRRLFYVAITRTRRILIISSILHIEWSLAHRMGASAKNGNRYHADTIASRFLHELGPSRPNPVVGTDLL